MIALNCINDNKHAWLMPNLLEDGGPRVWEIVCLALTHYPSIQTNAINHTRPQELYIQSHLKPIHKTL